MVMTEGATQAAAGSSAGIEVLRAPEELDLATADGLTAQGCAIAVHAGLLLLRSRSAGWPPGSRSSPPSPPPSPPSVTTTW
jgi:hypothetical protein